ncbi:DUF6141 family protein [Larkinella harenae]
MYKETQQFRQPWIWVLLIGVFGVTVYEQNYVSIGIVAIFLGLFALVRLETEINKEGISYRWFPFQPRPRLISWNQIERVNVRKYAPLGEFGGWGIRFSWNGTAHTTSGQFGIEIKLKEKKRTLLIGTQHPEAASRAVSEKTVA